MPGSDKEEEEDSKLPSALRTDPDAKTYLYRDFSNLPEDSDSDTSPPAKRGNSESSIRVQKFPVKLYAILSQKEFSDIITWMPHGRSWKVLKPNLFESLVMPLFFEYSNYHSFNRLVNAWSFRRISSGPDRGSYYHELFLRGKPHLQKYMRRLPKTHKKLSMRKQDEPDFYKMDKTSPLPQLQENPVNLMAMRRQAMAQAAAINAASMPGAGLGMNPALASARLPPTGVASYPGSLPGSLLSRPTDSFAGMEAASARLAAMEAQARLPPMEQPPPSMYPLAASLSPASLSASLPPSAASLPASLRGRGAGLAGMPAMQPPLEPPLPLDRANPLAAQNYQYQRMRHLQHLQLFQSQMGQGGGTPGAPPPPTDEELLRLQAYRDAGGGAFGRGTRPPYM